MGVAPYFFLKKNLTTFLVIASESDNLLAVVSPLPTKNSDDLLSELSARLGN